MKKWYTCTPVAFKGDHTFFYRDSGLFSRAFEEAGCESRAIMPLPAQEGDWNSSYLIRTEYQNLENPEWWKSLNLDGVLLYSWGAPKYEKVARAIKESGIKLIIYLDTSLGFYPFYDWKKGTKLLWNSRKVSRRIFPFLINFIKLNIFSILFSEPIRKRHLSYADMLAVPTPHAVQSLRKTSWYYRNSIKNKIQLICCPIPGHFDFEGKQKKEHILSIGRWDDNNQKRPEFLRATLEQVLSANTTVTCTILGQGNQDMIKWQQELPEQIRARVAIIGEIPNTQLPELYQSSMISLCSSEWESTHLVSAEALCCGCSIVAPNKDGMEMFQWYASSESGTLSKDTSEALAEAVIRELSSWKSGKRNPQHISKYWKKRLHAQESVKRILLWDQSRTLPEFNHND